MTVHLLAQDLQKDRKTVAKCITCIVCNITTRKDIK